MALRLRRGVRDDKSQIVALLNQSFRTPIDALTWEWYVYGNPLGESQIYVALDPDDANLVGVIGFAPICLRICGSAVAGDYAHHLALNPKYRDTLSYIALLRYSLKEQANRGRKLAIGPPNRTAYPIHKTLMKWVDFGFLDCLCKFAPKLRAHGCSEIKLFSSQFDDFYEHVSKDLSFHVQKNADWMNWRFGRRPGSPYTIYVVSSGESISGYVILKRWQDPNGYKKAHILDVQALDRTTLEELLAAAESYAADCDELNLWAVEGCQYRSALEAMGFTAGSRQPLIARPYDGSAIHYPRGKCSLSYGDGDTLY